MTRPGALIAVLFGVVWAMLILKAHIRPRRYTVVRTDRANQVPLAGS